MAKLMPLLVLVVCFILLGCNSKPNPDLQPVTSPPSQSSERDPYLWPLPTGKVNPVTGEYYKELKTNVLAVMVENTPQARPQSGLGKADVVYEMTAEGGITRFMAIYHANDAEVVGPVRSARTYYVTIVREWNAGYAHAGGNQDALDLIKKWGIQDLDEIYRLPAPYWRDNTRQAPHNLYTNTNELRPYVSETPRLRSWPFDKLVSSGGEAHSVKIPYNSFTNTTYRYQPDRGIYLRYIGSEPHIDKSTGKQLIASNVIIQYAVHKPGGVEPGAINITMTGKGKAEYLKEGRRFTGYWEKKGLDEETRFYLDDGNLFKLRPGTTWIQVVPTTMKLVYQ